MAQPDESSSSALTSAHPRAGGRHHHVGSIVLTPPKSFSAHGNRKVPASCLSWSLRVTTAMSSLQFELRLTAALRDMPWQRPIFDCLNDVEHNRTDDSEQENRSERTSAVERCLTCQDDGAETLLTRDELADDRTDERERNANLRSGKQARQRVGKSDLHHDIASRCSCRQREINHVVIDRSQSDGRIDDDRKDCDDRGNRELRSTSRAEPNDKQRRQRNFRNRIGRNKQRVERLIQKPRGYDCRSKYDATNERDKKANQRDVRGIKRLRREERGIVDDVHDDD